MLRLAVLAWLAVAAAGAQAPSGPVPSAVQGQPPRPKGQMPDLVGLAPECRFYARCPDRQAACRVPIPMTTAALGGQVDVPTIEVFSNNPNLRDLPSFGADAIT